MTNPDALNRFIAEKVMQWKTTEASACYYAPVEEGMQTIIKAQWNPYETFADCEPILEKIEKDGWRWVWMIYDTQYNFEMWKPGPNGRDHYVQDGIIKWPEKHSVWHDTRTAVLVLCVARAYGWKEE